MNPNPKQLRAAGIKTAIVSVSRNTDFILERLELRHKFDAVVTGIGNKTLLHRADYTLPATRYLSLEKIQALF